MYIEIYIDVVFVLNFVMDFIILLLEKRLLKRQTPLARLFLGAMFGAFLMCVIVLVPKLNYILYLGLSYFLTSMLIIIITFRPKGLRELLKLTAIMYIIAIVLGGIMFALLYYTSFGYGLSIMMTKDVIGPMTLSHLLLMLVIAVMLFVVFAHIFTKITNMSRKIYTIKMYVKDKEIITCGLLDTGNNLFDPITKVPVIIGENVIIKSFIGDEDFELFQDLTKDIYHITDNYNRLKKIIDFNIRLIPYTSIGNDNGMLIGFVVDKVIVETGKEAKLRNNIVLALHNKKLSVDNSYNVLLHPNLI